MNNPSNRLRELLRNEPPLNKIAIDSLDGLSDPRARLRSTRAIEADSLSAIYSKRAKVNEATGGAIIGFEDLLSNLRNENELVQVHLVDATHRKFVILTDESATRLVGILSIPPDVDEDELA